MNELAQLDMALAIIRQAISECRKASIPESMIAEAMDHEARNIQATEHDRYWREHPNGKT